MKRDSSVTGSIGEFIVMVEFLKRGFDVYQPIVDRGIDCLVGKEGNYCEIQIKTRDTREGGKYVFDVRNFRVRERFFIVCYQSALSPDGFWIIPSRTFRKYGYQTSKSKVYRLLLNPKKQKILEEYRNNFNQLGDPGVP